MYSMCLAGSRYNIVNHLFTGTTDDVLYIYWTPIYWHPILTLPVTSHKEMFVKQTKHRCECVQEQAT